MDYSKFLDENFDVKDWVNGAFKAHKESNKDQYATTLVMKLQMFIQEVNNVIEESCQQAITNLPRVMRELEAVKQEALLLQDQMKMVKYDIEKVEHDTAQSMQTLLTLDTIKSRMQAASEALQEADNWTTLSANVDEVFESGDIDAISHKLNGMQQSLHILTDVPDYADRCRLLEDLKNKLEATLSPQVVQAFSTQALDLAQKYVKIFSDMERLPQLTKYYHKCHKTTLAQSWRGILDEIGGSSLLECLTDFYDQLLSLWNSQIKWCAQVFEEPLPIVCDLLTETLTSVDPPISDCIENYLRTSENAVEALIAVKQVTERFVKGLEGAMETHTNSHLNQPCIERLAIAIYAPYKIYVKRFGTYEEATLSTALLNIRLDHQDVLECVRLLGESVSKLFAAADESNTRCVQFTNGCGYISLPPTLQVYFHDYVTEFHRVLINLREKCRPDSPSVEADDWSLFQNSLRIIQTCGDLILHTEELDQTVVSSIVTTVEKYCFPSSPVHSERDIRLDTKRNPFHDFKTLLLESLSDRNKLEYIITTLEEGDDPSILLDVLEEMSKLSETVHKFAYDIVFGPLQHQLEQVPTMEIWTSESQGGTITSNLPTFSLSPQEYITKIGQYLMTLPQQLEPFTLEDNPSLVVALKHGKLPFTAEQSETPEHLADLWLESIARGTMHTYGEQILKIPELTQLATSQLVTDIEYLSNVMDDLGLQPSESLNNITVLLKSKEDDYSDDAETMPQRLSSAIASMRRLDLD